MLFLKVFSFAVTAALAVNAGKIYHCTEKNTIALTFDDGPYEYTNELLDTLAEHNIKATFFINGENYWKDLKSSSSKQKVIGRAVSEGHQLASHTWYHEIPSTKDAIKADLKKVDDLIENAAGVRPKYFRAPGGNCGETCMKYIEDLGYKIIQWDLDTRDWDYKYSDLSDTKAQKERRVKESIAILKEEYNKNSSNYIILMHDVNDHTVRQIVPWIIKNTPSKYKFVTVAECLGDKNSAYSGNASSKTTTKKTTTSHSTQTNVSTNGRCGSSYGVCPSNKCCSKYGYCGTDDQYCGKGCQSEFGKCNTTSTTTKKTTTKKTTTSHSTQTNVSTNGRCGSSYGVCPSNKCCSKYGYCGTDDQYCGKGCQSEFGKCNTTSTTTKKTTTTKKATNTNVSTNGKCGKDYGICPSGYCCSQYGYCGKTSEYCDEGCNSSYGKCN